jgi:hypothetical protein
MDEMQEMGRRAREQYETRFRGATHLAALLDTYGRVQRGALLDDQSYSA